MEAGRLNAYRAAPDAMRAVQRVEAYIQQCGLEKSLIELVKMRASQINGCAYCLHVHSKDARHGGETEQRLFCSTPGMNHPSTPSASGLPWRGPKL
jgi:AhpD family alkylhydroperoxidase